MSKRIKCVMDSRGVLHPDPKGDCIVSVNINPPSNDVKTGTVSWGGMVKAFITFDITGTTVVAYTVTDMGITADITNESVENIIRHI